MWAELVHSKSFTQPIRKAEYEKFCDEFVFYKLSGLSFGKAFSLHFDLDIHPTYHNLSEGFARSLIEGQFVT